MFLTKLRTCFSKYLSRNFDLFFHVLKGLGIIKDKEEWGNELKEIMSKMMNDVVNKDHYIGFSRTVEEVFNVQIFFDSFQQDLEEIKKLVKYILKREK